MNGDGKADAIVVNDNGVTVRVSDGTKFYTFVGNKLLISEPFYGTRGTYFSDVNGDGKSDAIVVNDNGVTVRVSDGTKFLDNASWTSGAYYGTRGTYFSDVNGDGKSDAIVVNDNGVTVRVSDGTKFLDNASWTSGAYYGTRGTYFSDVNGDGKSDAIAVNDNNVTVRLSNGNQFFNFVGNTPWITGAYYGTRGTYFSDVNGDGKSDAILVTEPRVPPVIITRRIAGVNYFIQEKPDEGDGYSAGNGFLLVTHDPGCGVVGNDGNDKFFQAAGKPLPPGCQVIKTEFAQFWPTERQPDSPYPWAGSYDAVRKYPDYTVRWHNACAGRYSGKNLYYLISFIISMPEGTDLGEPSFDPELSKFSNFQPPANYGWNEPPIKDDMVVPPKTGSLIITFVFNNVIGINPTPVSITYTGTLVTQQGTEGIDKFTIAVNGHVDKLANRLVTDVKNLRAGTWRISAQPSAISGTTECIYDVSNGSRFMTIHPEKPKGFQCQ